MALLDRSPSLDTHEALRCSPDTLTWEQALPLLRIQLVPEATARVARGVYRPACEGLMLGVVVDFADHASHVTATTCAAWGQTIDDVFAHARARLALAELDIQIHTAGSLTIYEGDHYGAVALYATLSAVVPEQHAYVAFPNRDVALLAQPEHGADGLAVLVAAARDLSHGGLTSNVYWWNGELRRIPTRSIAN